jgi:hypothetical protein
MTGSKYITEFKTDRGYELKRMFFVSCVVLHYVSLFTKLQFIAVNTGLFINNEFVGGDSQIETINPATGKVIAKVEAGAYNF